MLPAGSYWKVSLLAAGSPRRMAVVARGFADLAAGLPLCACIPTYRVIGKVVTLSGF